MTARAVGVLGVALALGLGGLAACGAGDLGPDTCSVAISFSPPNPLTGTVVRASSVVANAPGVLTYTWHVAHGGIPVAFTNALPAAEDIVFTPATSGLYQVSLEVTGGDYCPVAYGTLTVTDDVPGALRVRLHVTPPLTLDVPPLDKALSIPGGGDKDISPVTLEPGVMADGAVTAAGSGVAAYVELAPLGMPDAPVATFTGTSGTFKVRMRDEAHAVLVIPTDVARPAQRFASWTPGDPALALAAGTPVTGVVRDGAGSGLPGAKVQLVTDGVPSAIGTTSATGTFSLLANVVAGAQTQVIVTPPAGSGLPRLEATDAFVLSQPLTVRYAAFAIRNLGGVHVRRAGAAQPGAKVTVVGQVAGGGTVVAGALTANATAVVRTTATADGTGQLPPTPVPGLPLTAVVAVAPQDLAVTALDLGAAVPADITAPAMVALSTRGLSIAGDGIAGVSLELVPTAALAAAGAPALRFTGDATGAVTGQLASGGHYMARWSDRNGEGGPRIDADVTAATLAGGVTLPAALWLTGELAVPGNPNPVPGAAVQVLCRDCLGLERDRPIGDAATDAFGRFAIAVPDLGAM